MEKPHDLGFSNTDVIMYNNNNNNSNVTIKPG